MREIKFRGRDVKTGEVVYGDFCKGFSSNGNHLIRCWAKLSYVEVSPESVEQFIAKDKNGVDVYEGDPILILGYITDEGEVNNFVKPFHATATMKNLRGIEEGFSVKAA